MAKYCVHIRSLPRRVRKMVADAGCDYCQEGRMEAEADRRFVVKSKEETSAPADSRLRKLVAEPLPPDAAP